MANSKKWGNIIGGKEDLEGDNHILTSPADGSEIGEVVYASKAKVEAAIDSSAAAFENKWLHTSLRDRKSLLQKLGDRVMERSDEYANLESLNTGKTIRQSTLMDIPLGIEHIRYFAEENEFRESRKISHPEYPDTTGEIQFAPMGVVGAIAPWNVPFLMAVWKTAPALLAGNTVVLKPSHFTPLTALELGKDALYVGFPPGVLNVVTGSGDVVGDTIAKSRKISMVSFTGSTTTGKRVMSAASASVKKVTLELGGKSPNIVFADCDIDHALKGVLFGLYLNSGQLCESGSRLLIQSSIKEEFVSRLSKLLEAMKAGNPMDMTTDVSAISNRKQLDKITTMVNEGIAGGATLLYRKEIQAIVPSGGLYYPPTIISSPNLGLEILQEEIFGPVLSVVEFRDEKEAIEIANKSDYGLAAGVWSKDIEKAKRVASTLMAGTIWINEYHLLSAAAPRGGFKQSGVGRELGLEGILEYTQTRHIFVNKGFNDQDTVAYGLVIAEGE